MKNTIVDIRFNNEPPTKYDYKHFDVIMKTGKVHTFHYHINNLMPTKEEALGLTYLELLNLTRKKFYDSIDNYIKEQC
jgi:hypothetical protein